MVDADPADTIITATTALRAQRDAANQALNLANVSIDELNKQIAAMTPADPVSTKSLPVRGNAALGSLNWATSGTVVNTTPGKAAAALKTVPTGGTLVLSAGTYNELLAPISGRSITIQAAPGAVVWLDGAGKLGAGIIASGRILVRGVGIRNYAPTSTENGSNAMVYLGGTAAGTRFEHCWFTGSTKAAVGGEVADVVFKNCVIENCGYSGITIGSNSAKTGPDRLLIEDSIIRNVNTGKFVDGQVAAVKVTRSQSPRFRNVQVDNTNGAPGLWTDVSCLDPVASDCDINACSIGVHFEETERATASNNNITNCPVGVTALASGHTKILDNIITGASVCVNLQQERAKNTGNDANRTQTECPWWSVGAVVEGNTLDAPNGFKIAIMAYADQAALGMLAGGDMIDSFKYNTIKSGSIQMGRKDGKPRDTLTSAQFANLLGAKYAA